MLLNTNSFNDFNTVLPEVGVVSRMFYVVDGSGNVSTIQALLVEGDVITAGLPTVPSVSAGTFLGMYPNAILLGTGINFQNMQ